jgi:hypothetical protein
LRLLRVSWTAVPPSSVYAFPEPMETRTPISRR